MTTKRSDSVPAAIQPAFDTIAALLDSFCERHLNDEYADLARALAAKLARKRPSPLPRGTPEVWACGIIHALGTVNFLFDSTTRPFLSSGDLSQLFGVNQNSTAGKSKLIRNMFKMYPFDHRWSLPSRIASSSPIWHIVVNGVIIDAREMPREVQELACAKGLIPYVPADRPDR